MENQSKVEFRSVQYKNPPPSISEGVIKDKLRTHFKNDPKKIGDIAIVDVSPPPKGGENALNSPLLDENKKTENVEKLQGALQNGAVQFSPKERKVLEDILKT